MICFNLSTLDFCDSSLIDSSEGKVLFPRKEESDIDFLKRLNSIKNNQYFEKYLKEVKNENSDNLINLSTFLLIEKILESNPKEFDIHDFIIDEYEYFKENAAEVHWQSLIFAGNHLNSLLTECGYPSFFKEKLTNNNIKIAVANFLLSYSDLCRKMVI